MELHRSGRGRTLFLIDGYDCRYMISNKIKVINVTNGQVLTPQPQYDLKGKLTGYSQVTFMQYGKEKTVTLHRLVGETQCKNHLNKNEYHHISTKKRDGLLDNRASNILPVWGDKDIGYPNQHKQLQDLLQAGKIDEYNEMVKEIKKENSQKIYEIPHLDFKSDDTFSYYMEVTSAGYNQYSKYGDVSLGEIVGEGARLKRRYE